MPHCQSYYCSLHTAKADGNKYAFKLQRHKHKNIQKTAVHERKVQNVNQH